MDTTAQQTMDSDMNYAVNNNGNGSYSQNNAKERYSGEIGNDYFVNFVDKEYEGYIGLVRARRLDKSTKKSLPVQKLHIIQVWKLCCAIISEDLDSNNLCSQIKKKKHFCLTFKEFLS